MTLKQTNHADIVQYFEALAPLPKKQPFRSFYFFNTFIFLLFFFCFSFVYLLFFHFIFLSPVAFPFFIKFISYIVNANLDYNFYQFLSVLIKMYF